MKNLTLAYITISLAFLYGIFAQKVFAESATPNPQIVPFPSLLITEVDFKNSQHDSITIQVVDDMNNGNGRNIKGLSLKDDSIFFTFDEDLYIRSKENIIISFKNDVEEIVNIGTGIQVNLSKSGLTGTTEQIITMYKEEILDAFCWTNSNPTTSEISELEDLFNKGGWSSSDITSCFSSDDIAANKPVIRKNLQDTNSKDDWEIKIEIVEEADTPQIVEIDEAEKPGVELEICNQNIFINEFLPNPSGKDTGNEWIEILNSSESTCSLYGWKVDDQEGGSKGFSINSKDLVPPGGYLLLPSWQTKLNLNNTEDSVRLFNPDNEKIDEIEYEDSPDNQSYAFNQESEEFLWTTQPTPLLKNIFIEEEEKVEPKKESKDKTETTTIENGSLSDDLSITEIFPNPKGQDKGLEWIEIHNDSSEDVKLGNWTIESNSKVYTFENITLASKEYLTLSDNNLGFSLKNTDETITLKDFNQNEISKIDYHDVIEAHSFMEIENYENDLTNKVWQWSASTTPGEANNVTYTYTGIINEFDSLTGKLKLIINKETPDEETLDITTLLSGDELSSAIFETGSTIKVIVRKENNSWILEAHTVLESKKEEPESEGNSNDLIYILVSSLAPLGFVGYSAAKKFGLIKIV